LAGTNVGYHAVISTERIVNLIESGWPVQVQVHVTTFFPLEKAVHKMDNIERAAQFVIL
jgi:hypothetical protein